MASLFRLFLMPVLKVWVYLVVGAVLGISVLSKALSIQREVLLGIFFPISLLLAIGQMSHLVSKNRNWLMVLPLSKKKILLFNIIYSVFVWIVFGLSCLIVAYALRVLHFGLSVFYKDYLELIEWKSKIEPDQSSLAGFLWKHGYAIIQYGCLVFPIIWASCFSSTSLKINQFYRNQWNHKDSRRRSLFRMGMLGIFVTSLTGWKYLGSGFGIFIFYTAILLVMPVFNACIALSMPNPVKKRLISISLGVALCQILTIYYLETNRANDPSNPRRIDSILFLGSFGEAVSRVNVAKLLESDLGQFGFRNLSNYYLEHFEDGRKLVKSQEPFLHLDLMVNARKTESDVTQAVHLFRTSDLDFMDLKLVFEKLGQVSHDQSVNFNFLSSLLSAQLTVKDTLELLKLNQPSAIRYALLRARYDRDPSFISAIESALPSYSDELRLFALQTLSILYGRNLGLDAWVDFRNGRGLAQGAGYFNVDCNEWPFKKIQELREAALPALNICLRQKMRRNNSWVLSHIESKGWIKFPLDSEVIRIASRDLGK